MPNEILIGYNQFQFKYSKYNIFFFHFQFFRYFRLLNLRTRLVEAHKHSQIRKYRSPD